ncbi:MAG: hypothetical protein A2487_12740 [Candidatus Raymondbacteria bacterium RifOxyC12_full_50_8]|uniref:Outer membrane protein beta-barrel domain-containing protein n=1 Tax=Candidatus Raymondbacteria bacterium RIFOXYD12_FULL_49_13 TaxID=1817890 RepID=A0A1F7FC84_UNCRA|nr:MAG: hypothetical protein A2248_03020 [Candidatus Raymondbacteria bacterium RIFOXYA2_FULL_49_16]OGJ93452.1 MAG: hypothetical protein A2350_18940 [Candidatus Raymondbacteria bacterium RifOxyB12_full_50_8]OGK04289.1 MAG: hypothetical protein A2519_18185 [Candidatus Raymondbacteria bacterium RIFOXYD12_FULL_49_13]OGK07984.1 MAG: hypothetical protein A2487_12740 [Candidatus Raymondbacteria bacterium RifOxyC12_full_50_8]OGP42427.1 MAG: hypothetical protein A2324_17055 [Candidatus Raymondbacteria b
MVRRFSIQTALVACFMLVFASSVKADLQEDITKLVGDNATSYIHPITNSLGVGMNSGWYNSSKSYKLFGLPIGLQANFGMGVSMTNDDLRKYDFEGEINVDGVPGLSGIFSALNTELQAAGYDTLPSKISLNKADVPTIVGAEEAPVFTLANLLPATSVADMRTFNVTANGFGQDTIPLDDTLFALPPGLNLEAVPYIPNVGINIGLPFKVQLGLRYFPTTSVPDFGDVGLLGLKVQYEFTEWVPVVNNLPLLHTSAFWAMNNLEMGVLELNNWISMVNVSADFKFLIGLGIYGGIGIESSTMNLNYTVNAPGTALDGQKVSLSDEGDNFFRAQAGVRLSLLIFDIFADANFGETTSYNLGIGIGLNGL